MLRLDSTKGRYPSAPVEQHLHEPVSKSNATLRGFRLAVVESFAVPLGPHHIGFDPRDLSGEIDAFPAHGDGFTRTVPCAAEVPHEVRQVLTHRDGIGIDFGEYRQHFIDGQRARHGLTLASFHRSSIANRVGVQRAMSHGQTANTR